MVSRFLAPDTGQAEPSPSPSLGEGEGATQAAPGEFRRISTDEVPEKHRQDYWQHVVGELVGGIEVRDCATDNFYGGFALAAVGDLKIGHFIGVSQTLHRKPDLIKPSDSDDYIVLLESNNTFQLEQGGRQHSGRGGMVLIDITQPYLSSHPEDLDVIDVFIPRAIMERALGPARHAAGLSIDASQPSFPVVAAFLRSLSEHGATLDAAAASRMSAIAVDLIASCFAEKIGHRPTRQTSGPAILCRAQAYIAENLGVPGLGMQEVAATLNMSIRKLHQIAADEGVSLVDWMWERRLLRARALLSDRANHAQSVGAIAFDCGFVDQAHFSRRFKLRFGQAPSEFKAASHSTLLAPSQMSPI